jgi:hypothetical protein
MNCESARVLLSAYFDRELEPDPASAVRGHLATCQDCALRLAEFEELSKLATDICEPEVPQGVWFAIESLLGTVHRQQSGNATRQWLKPSRAALAATLLIGASLALVGYWTWHSRDQHVQMAAVFDRYLGEFQEHPQQAQQVLRARYDGRPMDLQTVGNGQFVPNAPQDLPNGFARVETYLLNMPCCTCTQTTYKNQAGDVLVLYEHSEDQRIWFGDRPVIEAQCHGQPTFLVQLKDQLAASWKCGPRHLTVIGARNVEQVSELIAFLDTQRPASKG